MAYQETTRQSYGSKVKGSFQGILWGIILIIAGTVILWWNEGRALKASDALKDFEKNYVELTDISSLNPEFEGKAIHATGVAKTTDTLRDAAFGIAVNAMKLARTVEYYQWTQKSESESKDKLGGSTETTTTYTYEPAWCDRQVNSNEFKDPDYKGKNFVLRVVDETEQLASNVTFGAYRLTEHIVESISGEEPAFPSLTEEQKKQLLANVSDSTVVVTVSGDQVYIGADPSNPHIGDVRITFTQVTSPKTISLLQKVVNDTFESYVAKNGKQFSKVEMGTVSSHNMITHQKSANKVMLWLMRLLGIILVIAGNKGLLSFVSTVFAVVPFVQRIIGSGVGLVAIVIGIIWSILVIAVAWIAHRPVLGIALLVVAAALVFWLVSRSRKKKISNVVAALVICLMIGAGCTGTKQPEQSQEGDNIVAFTDFVGPVKAITVTQIYGEGEPGTTRYEFNEKGKIVSEKEFFFYDEEDTCLEALSEKDNQGRYTKQVWGSSDGEIYSYQIYQYDDRGNITFSENHLGDGTLSSTTWYTYDKAGHTLSTVIQNPYGTYTNVCDYDDKGNMIKSTNDTNGETNGISTYQYDEAGRQIMAHTVNPVSGQEHWDYTSFDKDGNQIAWTSYSQSEGVKQLQRQDSSFVDQEGLKHERCYENYGDSPVTYESTFNKQGFVTHYEQFEGTASNPSYVIDFKYRPDGVTLQEVTKKKLLLGQVKSTETTVYPEELDTFGNWTKRTEGLSYNFRLIDDEGSNGYDYTLTAIKRKFEYRGDDQGQNYGFTGRAGDADIRLVYSFDDDVLCGEVTVDGNTWRAVGYRNREDRSLYVVALKENGNIPWSMIIPAGDGVREGSLFKDGDEEITATFTPIREGLKTYSFATKPGEIPGNYEFAFGGDTSRGSLQVSRCGEDWKDIHFEVLRSGYRGTNSIAQDEFTEEFSDRTEYYRYSYQDESDTDLSYNIYFFDGFAIILMTEWNTSPTVQGIYAKLPAVG